MAVYYFAEDDYLELKNLITKNLDEIKAIKLGMTAAASETSETWHDNFGFEDGARNLDKIMNYTQELSRIFERGEIITIDEEEIFGKELLVNLNGQQEHKVISSYLIINNVANKISYACPLAQEIILLKNKNSKFLVNNLS